MIVNRKQLEVRGKWKSAVDAENELKTTEEYQNWKELDSLLKEIDKLERSCRNQGGLRKK